MWFPSFRGPPSMYFASYAPGGGLGCKASAPRAPKIEKVCRVLCFCSVPVFVLVCYFGSLLISTSPSFLFSGAVCLHVCFGGWDRRSPLHVSVGRSVGRSIGRSVVRNVRKAIPSFLSTFSQLSLTMSGNSTTAPPSLDLCICIEGGVGWCQVGGVR